MREPHKSVDYQMRLVQLCEGQCRLALDPESCAELLNAREALAWLLFKRGFREQAGALFAANRRLLENPPLDYEGRIDRIARISIDIDCKLGIDVSRSPGAKETERDESHDTGPLSRLRSLTDETQTPSEWARLTAEVLRYGNDPRTTSAARRESDQALLLTGTLIPRASLFRQVKDIDRADRVVDRIMALARHYLTMAPNHPAPHLILSNAYVQRYKNAIQRDDQAAEKTNRELALNAAQHALFLDPNNEVAQHAVYDLERRLADRRANP